MGNRFQRRTAIDPTKEAIPFKPKIRRKRLRTLADLQRFMTGLINDCRQGSIDSSLASKLGYLINIQKSIINDGFLEQRVAALENEMMERR